MRCVSCWFDLWVKLDFIIPCIFNLTKLICEFYNYDILKLEIKDILTLFKGSNTAKSIREDVTHFMESQIESDDLKKKVIPHYDVACKRITVSNDYLPTFNQSNVHLVTNRIQSIEKDFVQMKESSDSSEEVVEKTIPLDAIIYATGFDLLSVFEGIAIERPSDGKLLHDIWGSFPNAYLGIMQPQFPNLFFFLGPGTGLGKYLTTHSLAILLEKILSKKVQMKIFHNHKHQKNHHLSPMQVSL